MEIFPLDKSNVFMQLLIFTSLLIVTFVTLAVYFTNWNNLVRERERDHRSHCYSIRSNLKKMGPLQFCLLALLGIHRHPMQKEFSKSCEGFLRAALTVLGHPGPVWKMAKMALFDAMKVPFSDFIQKMSQAPSMCLSEHKSGDEFDYLKNPSRNFKNSFCSRVLWIPSNDGWPN